MQREEGEIQDMLEVVKQINLFYNEKSYPLQQYQEKALNVFWRLKLQIKNSNQTYENLLQENTKLTKHYEEITQEIEEIDENNQYLRSNEHDAIFPIKQQAEMMENSKSLKQIDGDQLVALDSGLIVTSKDQEAVRQQSVITVNIQKMDLEETKERDQIMRYVKTAQDMVFQIYLSLCQALIRYTYTLQVINQNAGKLFPPDLMIMVDRT